jgi:hypothetical protein
MTSRARPRTRQAEALRQIFLQNFLVDSPVDGQDASAAMLDQAARQRITLIGPLKGNGSWQHRSRSGFAREAFTIDYDRRQVTCPNGKTSGDWLAPPAQAPYLVVKFDRRLCDPCPDRGRCTRSRDGRTVTFPPRPLHEHQARNRIDQQDPRWLHTYGSRSGVEGTINEFANAHRTRDCRYRGLAKTHVQHVLTAIAVNIERLHAHQTTGDHSRPATAFQQYLINHGHPLPRWWRQGAA